MCWELGGGGLKKQTYSIIVCTPTDWENNFPFEKSPLFELHPQLASTE